MSLAAEQESLHAAPAMRCHHDEIASVLLGGLDDGFIGKIAGGTSNVTAHTCFPGRLFDHREIFLSVSLRVSGKLVPGILQHLRPVGEYAKLRHRVKSGYLGVYALGEPNPHSDRCFG